MNERISNYNNINKKTFMILIFMPENCRLVKWV